MALGSRKPSEATPWPRMLGEGRSLAKSLPDLLVEARRISNTIVAGWHGRRRSGPGETFWQFRPFVSGETTQAVDWRRSARDDHIYVREQEWDAAHTAWLWTDLSASMNFKSHLAPVTKRERSLVLMFAVADLLARGGERVGVLGLSRPVASRNAAELVSNTLLHAKLDTAWPDTQMVREFSEVIVFGDFLDLVSDLTAWLDGLAASGARGHLVQVLDPLEETFPFGGRTEFIDPETGMKLVSGRAEDWREHYLERMRERRERLRLFVDRLGWTFQIHHTDRPASEPLLALYAGLSASDSGGGGRDRPRGLIGEVRL
ncbi:MAG: DUF58 domain-containing protein [Pseudomonadota bacterium]